LHLTDIRALTSFVAVAEHLRLALPGIEESAQFGELTGSA
jgi:hypothetical protein